MVSGMDDPLRCKICGGRLIGDFERGEAFCSLCGLVLDERIVDLRPEWKALDAEDKERRVRVGPPITPTLHDYGLGSEMGPTPSSEATYSEVSGSYNSLRGWHKRLRASTPTERNLVNALTKINELCERLQMPKVVSETSSRIYRQLSKKGVVKSRSINKVVTAIVYFSSRVHGFERNIKEVAAASKVDEKAISKYYKIIASSASPEPLPQPSVERQIARLVNMIKLSPRVERLALQLSKATKDASIRDGKSPSGLAAAYVYMAAVMIGETLPQREVALAADITDVTVRHRYREILENFVIRQKLKPSKGM